MTPRIRVLPKTPKGPQLVNKFSAFYVTRRFITAFTSTRQLSLSWARSIQSMTPSHFLKINFNIILPLIHLRLDLPRGLFPSGLPNNSPVPLCATCPGHLILLDDDDDDDDDDNYTGIEM